MACPTATVEITQTGASVWCWKTARVTPGPFAQPSPTGKLKCLSPFCRYPVYVNSRLSGFFPWHLGQICSPTFYWRHLKIETTGLDYAETNNAPWTRPCGWPANLKHFVSWIEIGQEALQRFAISMKFKASLIWFKFSLKCYDLTFKRNNNVRRLSKLFFNS